MKLGTIGLLNSKRGVICLMLIFASTAMAFGGLLTASEWMDYTKWIGTLLVTSHTVSHAVEAVTKKAGIPEAKALPSSQ